MSGKAIEKLRAGEKAFKGNMKAMFMKNAVCEALVSFCKQNEEFADAVMVDDKTFKGAMEAVVKKIEGNAIPDIDAYRAAASYFFPGMVIDITMNIRMSEYEEPVTAVKQDEPMRKEKMKKAKILSLDLDDLF